MSLTVSRAIVHIFLFSHISLFAFAFVFILCNVCAWHACNKGDLLTYLLYIAGIRCVADRTIGFFLERFVNDS